MLSVNYILAKLGKKDEGKKEERRLGGREKAREGGNIITFNPPESCYSYFTNKTIEIKPDS